MLIMNYDSVQSTILPCDLTNVAKNTVKESKAGTEVFRNVWRETKYIAEIQQNLLDGESSYITGIQFLESWVEYNAWVDSETVTYCTDNGIPFESKDRNDDQKAIVNAFRSNLKNSWKRPFKDALTSLIGEHSYKFTKLDTNDGSKIAAIEISPKKEADKPTAKQEFDKIVKKHGETEVVRAILANDKVLEMLVDLI